MGDYLLRVSTDCHERKKRVTGPLPDDHRDPVTRVVRTPPFKESRDAYGDRVVEVYG